MGESGDNADLGLAGEGDVVVDELTPGYQQDGDSMVVPALILQGNSVHRECFLTVPLAGW